MRRSTQSMARNSSSSVINERLKGRNRRRSRRRDVANNSQSSNKDDLPVENERLKRDLFRCLGYDEKDCERTPSNASDGNRRVLKNATAIDRDRLESIVEQLEQGMRNSDTISDADLLCGEWRLLCTFKNGVEKVDFFDAKSWERYLFAKGPSPVQSLVLGNTQTVENVYQVLGDPNKKNSKWENVAVFTVNWPPLISEERRTVRLVIEAEIEGVRDSRSFFYRFSNGYFEINNRGEDGNNNNNKNTSMQRLPYPVPFGLLESLRPGQTKGWFETTYLDEDLRISVGQKGSKFILVRS